jgi:hypothetical protein
MSKFVLFLQMNKKLIKYEFYFILIIIFVVHQIIFLKFFPNSQGLLGHDYESFLPHFIFGKIWFKNNLLTIPWFTPSFCCGTPFYADPQTMFYSIQQIFFILFEPIFALKLMFIYFSLIAYLGMFFLLKRSFNFSDYASLLGATIFIFNGFFVYRAIVGHVAYLNFTLIPFYCFFLFESITNKNKYLKSISLSISALILASFFYSGSGPIMPLILSAIVVVVIFFYFKTCSLNIIKSFFLSFFLGLFISSSKISASLFFLDNFKRHYPPLIFANIVDYLFVVFNSLFIFPDIKLFNETASISLGIHEIEYGVTIVPLIAFFIFFFIKKNYVFFKDLKILFLVSFIIILPIIFNTNIFFLQKILAKVPILNSTWVQIRWSAFYIIPLIFLTVFILDSFKYLKRTKICIFLLIIIFQNIVYNKLYYHNQFYEPKNMINFSKNINISDIYKKIDYDIRGIGFLTIKNNGGIYTGIRNDLFSINLSSIFFNQPMFGYSLENFPSQKLTVDRKVEFNNSLDLSTGDLKLVLKDNKNNNIINFLNPSCFLFPKENNCNPGDLFNAQDNDNFKNFINYRPIKFNKNSVQIFFDYLSLFIFILLNIFIITNLVLYFRRSNQ